MTGIMLVMTTAIPAIVRAGSAADVPAPEINTTLAACSAGLTALIYSYARTQKWDLGLTVNGFLGGLVAITAPCY